jgi:uncharacterized membrane protein YhhN
MIGINKSSGILNTRFMILSLCYFLIGITYIVLPFIPVSLPPLLLKSLIIPVLIILFQVSDRKKDAFSHWLLIAALFFSWAGDVALGIQSHQEIMFMAGLVFFLLTHILYFIVFVRTPGKNLPLKLFFISVIPLLLFGLALLYILYDDLGAMKIPVIIYTTVILAMVAAAISRVGKVNQLSYYIVLLGALLFLSSDSMLAMNKFSHPFQWASPLIMFTYIAGQYLIVTGYLSGVKFSDPH